MVIKYLSLCEQSNKNVYLILSYLKYLCNTIKVIQEMKHVFIKFIIVITILILQNSFNHLFQNNKQIVIIIKTCYLKITP